MNKLAILALFILMLLGGAMWSLAGGSLNHYVKVEIEKNGAKISDHQVNVHTADIDMVNGKAVIQQVSFVEKKTKQTVLSIERITADFDTTSVNQNPIIINKLTFDTPIFHHFSTDGAQTSLSEIKTAIEKSNSAIRAAIEEKNTQLEPFFQIRTLVINDGKIIDDDAKNTTTVENNVEGNSAVIDKSFEDGYSQSLIAADTLNTLLDILSKDNF